MENGDKRVCMETFVPEIYVAGRWCSMETLVDMQRHGLTDWDGFLKTYFLDRWQEAKEYLESYDEDNSQQH